jgi:signal transduction histidine kinase
MIDGPIKILLVEDNPGDALLLRESLLEARGVSFTVEVVARLATGLARLREGGIDVVLLDLGLPDSQGSETFSTVHEQVPEVPVIVLTGLADESLAVRTVSEGAQDYLVKGEVSGELLGRAIRYAIRRNHTDSHIRSLNANLERRVLERTSQLEAANGELEAFTYSVSHDLRAPLRQIDGFARILGERLGPVSDPQVQHYLGRVQESARHMGRLVDDLLRLAHVGRQSVRRRTTRLEGVVQDAIEDLHSEIGESPIQWTIRCLPTVECDPGLMKIAFTNLLSNAIKYSRPQASPTIEVGCSTDHDQVVVFVRDNGVGFDMKYADKLFGVFQRLHRADEFEGTGVGLATVQRIVHKHGGRIWAEAELDKGATFYFTTPTVAASEGSLIQ